ncbi:MAG TPA: hypothetical protein VE081_08455 [Sporichthyaceae bacterium]|nr:hypothetical protein [Sporichthyaceae bacterium]
MFRARRLPLAALMSAVLGLAACGPATFAAPSATPTPLLEPFPTAVPAGTNYVLFPGNVPGTGWQITSAAQLGDPATQDSLDQASDIIWSAEYEDLSNGDTDSAPYLEISAFNHPLERTTLQISDPKATEGKITGRRAMWGTDPQDPDGQVFVAISLTWEFTIELYAYNMTVDELRHYAGLLQVVKQDQWRAANKSAGVGTDADTDSGEAG